MITSELQRSISPVPIARPATVGNTLMPPFSMGLSDSLKDTQATNERFCLVSNGLFIGSEGESACLVTASGVPLSFCTRFAAQRAADHLRDQFPDVAVVSC